MAPEAYDRNPAQGHDRPIIDTGLLWVAAGYWVRRKHVLLVETRHMRLWVPPGGHLEPGETFAEAVVREFLEETGVNVQVLSAAPIVHPTDDNATPQPVPFYADLERAGFPKPALVEFFFVDSDTNPDLVAPSDPEILRWAWFDASQLDALDTYAQVRSVARYALLHHPAAQTRS